MVQSNKAIKMISFYRKAIGVFLKLERVVDLFAILTPFFIFIYYAPIDILNSLPATGGDTGSHFWPLHTLVNEALPQWQVRVWNPGNLGGEPHLTHYFPLPYFIMAFISLFVPLGMAFNIGTILPVIFFPTCVYFGLKALNLKFPAPMLATAASLSFLYNESFSMWGGNTLSTLAGQFAHVYAFNFFLLGIGALRFELMKRTAPWLSMWLFSFVLLSHFYVALLLPLIFVVFLFFEKSQSFKSRLKHLLVSGVGANLLAIWFILPMLHNSPWNTAFGLKWNSQNLLKEVLPSVFWPFCWIFCVGGLLYGFLKLRKKIRQDHFSIILLLTILVIGSSFYFIFPYFGLVDVRVIPALQMVLVIVAMLFLSAILKSYLSRPWLIYFSVLIASGFFWWSQQQVVNFPFWMKWNYSGWQSKNSYQDLLKLSERIRGDYSDGRILFEHNDYNNIAGTTRVFEMLPYFAGRATLESVYMQATILAPVAFYLQAIVSKTPSCPFPNYACTGFDVSRMANYSQLLGISELILITPEVRNQAQESNLFLTPEVFGGWHLYPFKNTPSLVEVISPRVDWVSEKQYKSVFYEWFQKYKIGNSYLVADRKRDKEIFENLVKTRESGEYAESECKPQLKVNYNQLELETNCPGKFHLIKFAFHSTWKASTNDHLFLVSPGLIGLFPSQNKVKIVWGQHWIWQFAVLVSWLTLICWLLLFGYRFIKPKVKEKQTIE